MKAIKFYSISILTIILLNGNCAIALNVSNSVLEDFQIVSSDPEHMQRRQQYLKTHAAEAGILAERIASKPSSMLQLKECIYSLPITERLSALFSILAQCEQGGLGKDVAFGYFNPSNDEGFGYSEGLWQLASYFRDPRIREIYQKALSVLGDQELITNNLEDILSGEYRASMLKNCFYFPDQYKRVPPRLEGKDTWDGIRPGRKWNEKEQEQIVKHYFVKWNNVLAVAKEIYGKKVNREEGVEKLKNLEKQLKLALKDLQDLRSPQDVSERTRLVTLFRNELASSFVQWQVWNKQERPDLKELTRDIRSVFGDMLQYYQLPDCYLFEEMMRGDKWNEEFARQGEAFLNKIMKQGNEG